VKPFAFSELLARNSYHSTPEVSAPVVTETARLADLELDLARQRATRAGHRLELTSTEFTLLACLVRAYGETLSRRVLAEQVWDMHFESDTNVVDVGVRRLRAKVDDPFATKLITRSGGSVMCVPKEPEVMVGAVSGGRPNDPPGALRQRMMVWYAGSAFVMVAMATGCLYWALKHHYLCRRRCYARGSGTDPA